FDVEVLIQPQSPDIAGAVQHGDQTAAGDQGIVYGYACSETEISVIPDKNCFLARESGHLSMDYAQLESLMAQKVGFADYISISDLLERDDYYRTDTHWRQER
ncbi:hypothetical protein NE659_26895, partial [Flavonifractor plautii]|nr:hypothetical protein [Flavonifractor plautii]